MTERVVRVVLTCAAPPAAQEPIATFGLQDKRQQVHAGEPQPDGALRFACELTVRPHPQTGAPDFAGPFVHGKLGERFLYLSLMDLRSGVWIRRMKVMLTGIGWELIEAVAPAPSVALVARVDGLSGARAQFEGEGWHVET